MQNGRLHLIVCLHFLLDKCIVAVRQKLSHPVCLVPGDPAFQEKAVLRLRNRAEQLVLLCSGSVIVRRNPKLLSLFSEGGNFRLELCHLLLLFFDVCFCRFRQLPRNAICKLRGPCKSDRSQILLHTGRIPFQAQNGNASHLICRRNNFR